VKAGFATLQEIRSFWDINEVMAANEILDAQSDAEWLAYQEQKEKIDAAKGKAR
jgi:hypothetical protein